MINQVMIELSIRISKTLEKRPHLLVIIAEEFFFLVCETVVMNAVGPQGTDTC